ncbi:ABC transporter ATP-binding protein [Longispora albida]|uniref:ABC transporter ATP-binding protein n=1 Tax=Longispora albida TaxID=203523 RepID=UPI000365E142|nr:ATP-binding cassette domain-containing protein [Longispora albida]
MRLTDIRHAYGPVEVLHGIDLTVEPGELVALLGPSGSGKTTLLAIAGGLLSPASGTVSTAGRPAFVLQGGALIPYLTVEENLLVRRVVAGQRITAADRARAAEILAAVDLAGLASRYPAQLSGGEKQRTCVAQALFTGAPVLLADEPTSALDRVRGRAVMELLARHAHDSGAAVLIATHDERSLDLVDRVERIEDGQLLVHTS